VTGYVCRQLVQSDHICTILFTYCLQTFVGLLEEANRYPLGLFSSTGDIWKASRHILSPAFSARKLKQVLYYLDQCVFYSLDFYL